jgi:transcriptional regulator with XRE-family HTH domain
VSTVSAEVAEKTRKYQSTTLQAVVRVGQIDIAAQIGIDDSTVSRFMSDEKGMARALQILAAAGLKVVPADMQCFPPRKVQLLLELARDHLKQLETVEQLQWD